MINEQEEKEKEKENTMDLDLSFDEKKKILYSRINIRSVIRAVGYMKRDYNNPTTGN